MADSTSLRAEGLTFSEIMGLTCSRTAGSSFKGNCGTLSLPSFISGNNYALHIYGGSILKMIKVIFKELNISTCNKFLLLQVIQFVPFDTRRISHKNCFVGVCYLRCVQNSHSQRLSAEKCLVFYQTSIQMGFDLSMLL